MLNLFLTVFIGVTAGMLWIFSLVKLLQRLSNDDFSYWYEYIAMILWVSLQVSTFVTFLIYMNRLG